jgi:hypothetical protein
VQKVVNLESDMTLTAYYKEAAPPINLFPLFLLAVIFFVFKGRS